MDFTNSMTIGASSNSAEMAIPLLVEDVSIKRRRMERTIRVHVHTDSHDQLIDEALAHEKIEIERVAIGRAIEAVPPVREEGDTTVIPVVEEVLVVERRLVLKEEIRLRRVHTTERHRETVTLRKQHAVIERVEAGEGNRAPRREPAPIDPKHQTVRE
jgi:stress response protein YsnF